MLLVGETEQDITFGGGRGSFLRLRTCVYLGQDVSYVGAYTCHCTFHCCGSLVSHCLYIVKLWPKWNVGGSYWLKVEPPSLKQLIPLLCFLCGSPASYLSRPLETFITARINILTLL